MHRVNASALLNMSSEKRCQLLYKYFQGWEFAPSLICSFRSNQMSDCERFAKIAQDKWATVSEWLRSHRGNERLWANRSGRSRNERPWEFAQVAHDKWANEQITQKNFATKIKILFISMFYKYVFLFIV